MLHRTLAHYITDPSVSLNQNLSPEITQFNKRKKKLSKKFFIDFARISSSTSVEAEDATQQEDQLFSSPQEAEEFYCNKIHMTRFELTALYKKG